MVLDSHKGSHLVYFAKGLQQEVILVMVNISVDKENNTVRTFPVKVDNVHLIANMVLEVTSCPYMPEAFAVLAYDPREKTGVKEKFCFVTSISVDSLLLKNQRM